MNALGEPIADQNVISFDVDLRGAFMLPARDVLGLHPPDETITIEDNVVREGRIAARGYGFSGATNLPAVYPVRASVARNTCHRKSVPPVSTGARPSKLGGGAWARSWC